MQPTVQLSDLQLSNLPAVSERVRMSVLVVAEPSASVDAAAFKHSFLRILAA